MPWCWRTGGYGNVFYLSTNAKGSNATAIWRAHKTGALFANPCFTQIHPTCIPVSGEYQIQAHADERIAAQRRTHLGARQEGRQAPGRTRFRKTSATTSWSASIRASATWCRATWRRRNAKAVCDDGRGVGESGLGVYLDFRDAIERLGKHVIKERYGNLFDMYERITGEDPYAVPMRIYPAIHYTMGGLWVDYNLMSTIPGLFVIGEANFSDHGANRLGASALMQGLADGYFVLPNTIGDYLASNKFEKVDGTHAAFRDAEAAASGFIQRTARHQGHAERGFLPSRTGQDHVGLLRDVPHGGRTEVGARQDSRTARTYWRDVKVLGGDEEFNQSLEKAGRVADFFETGRADVPGRAGPQRKLRRRISAKNTRRRRARPRATTSEYSYAAAWEFRGVGQQAGAAQRAASRSNTCIPSNGATSNANLILHIWRQKNADAPGRMVRYEAKGINQEMSFLEMLDVVNEDLIAKGEEPIAFDHDCREGICGMCGFMINGMAHGPLAGYYGLPASHAALQGRRRNIPGTVACAGVPRYPRPGGGPQRVRPDHRGRRLRFGSDRQRAGCATPFLCPRKTPTAPWTRRPVSDAGPA